MNTRLITLVIALIVSVVCFIPTLNSPTYSDATAVSLNSTAAFQYEVKELTSLYDNAYENSPIAYIQPQTVTVISAKGNWYLIKTWIGPKWINISKNSDAKFYTLDVMTPIYSHIGAKTPTGFLSPQTVSIVKDSGRWLGINTWLGVMWIDLKSDSGFLTLQTQTNLYNDDVERFPIGSLAPQTVHYIDNHDNWYLIETWIGEKWIIVKSANE